MTSILSDKASAFEGANFDLPMASGSGVLIRVIEIDGHLRIMLEIGDDTTHDDIRQATRLALDWRDRLLIWQGPWRKGGPNELLERMHYMQDNGMSYGKVANYLNDVAARQLGEPDGVERVRDMLLALRLSEKDVDELLSLAVQRMAEGEPPFEREYPLSRGKVIGLLKDWRAKRKPDDADDD